MSLRTTFFCSFHFRVMSRYMGAAGWACRGAMKRRGMLDPDESPTIVHAGRHSSTRGLGAHPRRRRRCRSGWACAVSCKGEAPLGFCVNLGGLLGFASVCVLALAFGEGFGCALGRGWGGAGAGAGWHWRWWDSVLRVCVCGCRGLMRLMRGRGRT